MKWIIGLSMIAVIVVAGCGGGGGGGDSPGTVAAPTFNLPPGTYTSAQNVAISTTTPGASIRFTTDGSTPTSTTGTLYSSPIPIGATTTVKAVAFLAGWNNSPVVEATYVISPPLGTVEAPAFNPAPGTYTSAQNVAISTTTPGASIRFTTDGSTPTSTTGTLYSSPIPIGATTTVKAVAYLAGWNDSPVMAATYVIIIYTVNAETGSDVTGNGVTESYRTITKALSMAGYGDNVTVAPGTYDNVLGETFPIVIPPGVKLIGDVANKGNGSTQTLIRGAGNVARYPANYINITVYPGDNTTISGFTIHNDSASAIYPMAVVMNDNGVTVNNNSIVAKDTAIYVAGGGAESVISGNVIQNNTMGIVFVGGSGGGTRIENNVIAQNYIGVEYDGPAIYGDLGGGATGSVGGNVIAGNTAYDLLINMSSISTVDAANNRWDHVPPTSGGTGSDIGNPNGATIVTTGASLAP